MNFEPTLITVLLAGIASVTTGIVVMYRDGQKERKKHNEEVRELHKLHIEVTEKFVISTSEMKSATEKVAEAVERNTVVVNDLHKTVLSLKQH